MRNCTTSGRVGPTKGLLERTHLSVWSWMSTSHVRGTWQRRRDLDLVCCKFMLASHANPHWRPRNDASIIPARNGGPSACHGPARRRNPSLGWQHGRSIGPICAAVALVPEHPPARKIEWRNRGQWHVSCLWMDARPGASRPDGVRRRCENRCCCAGGAKGPGPQGLRTSPTTEARTPPPGLRRATTRPARSAASASGGTFGWSQNLSGASSAQLQEQRLGPSGPGGQLNCKTKTVPTLHCHINCEMAKRCLCHV